MIASLDLSASVVFYIEILIYIDFQKDYLGFTLEISNSIVYFSCLDGKISRHFNILIGTN